MFNENAEWDLAIAVYIHDRIIEVSGGAKGFHDQRLVESAVARPLASAFGIDLYQGTVKKAAALLDAIANNHGFRDGNKRTAMALAVLYLQEKGISVKFTNAEYEEVMLWVVTKKPSVKQIAGWLKSHSSDAAAE